MKKYCKNRFKKCRKEKWKVLKKQFGMVCVLLIMLCLVAPEIHTYAATPIPVAEEEDESEDESEDEPDWISFEPVMIMRYIASLFLAYISFKGAIQVGNNVSEYSKAMKNQDDASKQSALDGLFGGALQFFITGLLAVLGITI